MFGKFDSTRLTIVDFMGVFLPGGVWTILFLTANKMMENFSKIPSDFLVTPVSVAFHYTKGYDPVFYVGITVVSLLFGYFNMAISTKPAQFIANTIYYLTHVPKKNSKRTGYKDYLEKWKFPYIKYFVKKSYFEDVKEFVYQKTGYHCTNIESSSSYQPFETCKRLLKIHAPVLSEEANRREAQVRMLASLLLASVFNIMLSLSAFISSFGIPWISDKLFPVYQNASPYSILFPWLVTSFFIAYVTALTFSLRRCREVEDVYLCTLIVCKGKSINDPKKAFLIR